MSVSVGTVTPPDFHSHASTGTDAQRAHAEQINGNARVRTGGPSSEVGLGAGRDWLLHPHARNTATHKAPFYWINSRLRTGIQRWLSPAVSPCLAPLSASLPWLFLAGGSGTCTAELGGGKTWGWGGLGWGCQQTQAGKCVLKTAYKAGNV